MRVASINAHSLSFGKFLDEEAKVIAQKVVSAGRLQRSDYNILEDADIVHFRSVGDTLQGKINEKALKGVEDRLVKRFKGRVTPDELKNVHEKDKLAWIATCIESMFRQNPDSGEAGSTVDDKEFAMRAQIFTDYAK